MSETLRDMIVSINFKDVDTKKLLGIDKKMDKIENSINRAGKKSKKFGEEVENAGKKSKNPLTRMMAGFKSLDKSIDNVEKKTKELPKSFKKMGGAIGVGVGVATAAVGGLTAGLGKMFLESEKTFDLLEARTGTSGAELEGLKDIANSVYRDGFGDSLGQVSKDMSLVRAQFRDLNEKELEGTLKGMYTLGTMWDADTKEISRATKNMVDNFKDISTSDALSLMQVAFQKTGDYSGDLLDTFNEYSGYFAEMGFSARNFANTLVKASEAGAWNMDKAGDAIKELGIQVLETDGNAAKAFKTMGFNSKEMANNFAQGGKTAQNAFVATMAGLSSITDDVKRNALGVQLFGTMWEDLRGNVVMAMTDGRDEIGYFTGQIEKATDTIQSNVSTKMVQSFRELKGAAIDAFMENGGPEFVAEMSEKMKDLLPDIMALIRGTIEFGQTFSDNWSKVEKLMYPVKLQLGVVLGVVDGIAYAARAIGDAFNWTKSQFSGLTASFKDFKLPGWFGTLSSVATGGIGKVSSLVSGAKNLIMGSHATGLENVPFDGYTAELHKGESVLTANQSDSLRSLGILSKQGDKPKVNAPVQQGVSNSTPTNFNPSVTISVTQLPGENSDDLASKIKNAVNESMSNLFRQLNVQVNKG